VTFSSNGYVSTSTGSFGSTASTFPSGDLGELGLALEFDAFGTLLTDINIFDCMNPPRITNLEDLGEL
jgi:hypothetical protein